MTLEDGAVTSAPPRVVVEGVRKSFRAVPVLRDVNVAISAGEVLGLVGENGAGKSTLMNILGGTLLADAGSMRVDGRPYVPRTPADARTAGIAFVHQELTLFPNLTIAENLQLVCFPLRTGGPWIDRAASRDRAVRSLQRVGLLRSPDTRVEQLSAGERQLVEIARALDADARVLILDEPTTSLGGSERDRLHGLVRELRAAGLSIVYISHELKDVLRECDRVSVLRDGVVVATGHAGDLTVDSLVRHMVGREVQELYPTRRSTPAVEPVLEVRRVTGPGSVTAISLTIHRGEIVGLFGLMGAGRSEFARVLFGLDRQTSGQIVLEGVPLRDGPAPRIAQGLAFVTEDRHSDGLCLEASVADNLALPSLRTFSRPPLGILHLKAIARAVREVSAEVCLTGNSDVGTPVARLSGGNQQKVVLGKWLLTRPRVLILDEPTRGIDIGARAEIYQLLHRLVGEGTGLLVISSDLDELIGLCDRILVMRQGGISAGFLADSFDREDLLRAALPASVE
jgi:ribose transport system ATP-binding protein